MIYFDNAGSTIVDKDILNEFNKDNLEGFANPSSFHLLGLDLSYKIENKKREILEKMGFNTSNYEVVITSGATEANNIAILGYARNNKSKGNHLITSEIEHPSVLNVFKELEKEGFTITYLKVKNNEIDYEELQKSLSKDTILVSIMAVNNETGLILNLKKIKEIIKEYPKIVFHSDLAQYEGKIKTNISFLDMATISAYKNYGLKGVGALIKKRSVNLTKIIYGGSQEYGLRSGTVSYPLFNSLYLSVVSGVKNLDKRYKSVEITYNYLFNELSLLNGDILINSLSLNEYKEYQSPYILSFSLKKKKASILVEALSNRKVYVSTKSSCSDKIKSYSHVIYSLTNSMDLAENTIRLSFSKDNTLEEAKEFITILKEELTKIKDR